MDKGPNLGTDVIVWSSSPTDSSWEVFCSLFSGVDVLTGDGEQQREELEDEELEEEEVEEDLLSRSTSCSSLVSSRSTFGDGGGGGRGAVMDATALSVSGIVRDNSFKN